MPIAVEGQDGTIIEFPDGSSRAYINNALREMYPEDKSYQTKLNEEGGQRRTPPAYDASFAKLGTGPKPKAYSKPRKSRTPDEKERDERRFKANYKSDELGVTGRAAVRGVGPATGGFAGGVAGFQLAAPLAPITFGTAPFVGGLIGGLGGAYLGHKAQKSVIDMMPEDFRVNIGQNEAQIIADVEAHPGHAYVGENLPGFLTGRPTLNVASNLIGAGTSGVLEAGNELVNKGKIDPKMVGLAALTGAAQTKGWGLARLATGPADNGVESELRKYRPPIGDGRNMQADVRASGETPLPVDVLPKSILGIIGAEARTGSPNATTRLVEHADNTLKATPARGARASTKIAPTDPRTGREAATQASEESVAAQQSVRPDVPLGDASTAIAERLLRERTTEHAAADQLYAEAKSKGIATLQRKAPLEGEDEGWAPMTSEEIALHSREDDPSSAAGSGSWINRKTGEVVSADRFRDMQRAKGPGPEVAGELRDAIKSYALRPGDIEGTSRLLADADKWSTVDTSNLYSLRESLSDLERAYAGTPDAAAAAAARHKLDDLMARYDEEGRFTGDPEVVRANRTAIQNWKTFRQRYDVGTLLGDITKTEWRGDRRQPTNDPQTARSKIMGGLTDKGDRVRDFQEMRDRLGGPEDKDWLAFRQEAVEQLLGKQADKPDYVKKLNDWRRANPKMAELLLGPSGDKTLGDAETTLADVKGRESAMGAGSDFLTRDPIDFDTDVAGMTNAAKRDATVAARQEIRDALNDPQSALKMLSDIATSPKAQANLRRLAPQEADGFIRDAKTAVTRVEKARAPLTGGAGSDEATALATDLGRAAGAIPGGVKWRAASNVFMDLLQGKGTPDRRRKEADQLAKDLLDPTKTEATLKFVEKMHGQNAAQRLMGVMRQGAAGRLDSVVRVGRLGMAYQAGENATREEPRTLDDLPKSGGEVAPIAERMTDAELEAKAAEEKEGEGGPEGSKGGSLTERLNNPGAMRAYPWVRKLPGYVGEDEGSRHGKEPGMAVFENSEAGAAGQEKLLVDRYLARGINTPSKIVEKYAPGSDPRNTPAARRNYKAYIAKRLGIGINDPIPPSRVGELRQAQAEFESGNQITS